MSVTDADILHVIEGLTIPDGVVNVDDATLRAHIAASIRRQHPQLRMQAIQRDRVCLVGGGPSLNDTLPELLELLRAGAKLATVNGAYHWALEHNLEPKCQIVMDARASNARFVDPPLPRCYYLLSDTCHPTLWDRVAGREKVMVWHPVLRTDPAADILDSYYGVNGGVGLWEPVAGGTTVITRAMFALRMLGYLRMDLFGVDSCWMGTQHHAYAQEENDGDRRFYMTVSPTGHPELAREFVCAPWHLKQLEDFLRIVRVNGTHFMLNLHGDGLLAYVVRVNADLADITTTKE